MIGHELIADRSFSGWGLTSTLAAPVLATSTDVENFLKGRLDAIQIDDTQRGNSYQDLLLTWIGYRFGERMANNQFASREESARWLTVMLTEYDLGAVKKTDPFYKDAQELKQFLDQFKKVQEQKHPTRD